MMVIRKKNDRNRTGQSIVEYLLLLGIVIVLLLFFLRGSGVFTGAYNSVIEIQGDDMLNMARSIFSG